MYVILDRKKGTYHFSKKLSKALSLKTKGFVFIVKDSIKDSFYIASRNRRWVNNNIECVDVRYDPIKKMRFVVNTMPHPCYVMTVLGVPNQVKKIRVAEKEIGGIKYFELCN